MALTTPGSGGAWLGGARVPPTGPELDLGELGPLSGLLSRAERHWDLAEHDLAMAQGILAGQGQKGAKTLHQRLLELHLQESQKEHRSSHLNPCSNLLSQLCQRDATLRRLIFTLFPENRGYSCHVHMAQANPPTDLELLKLPYPEDDLLGYIDAQEVPPLLLDLLDGLKLDLFYEGCLIAEIRDLRRKAPSLLAGGPNAQRQVVLRGYEVDHVLLRPTTQSIICDSNLLAAQHGSQNALTREDRLALEAQLVLRTQTRPLCLDPDPVVSVLAKKADVAKKKLSTAATRRAMHQFSQVGLNRKRKLEQGAAPKEVALLDFITQLGRKRAKGAVAPSEALQKHQAMARQIMRSHSGTNCESDPAASRSNGGHHDRATVHLTPPQSTKVAELARPMVKRAEVTDMTPHIVEEYVLETAERGSQRVYHTRLTIFQRLANDEYLGELYVERDYRENENKGSTCRFVLGTRPHALKYINQFTEIFTEEGRKSVKITHRVPNQAPRVSFTPGMRDKMNNEQAALNRITAPIPVAQANSGPATVAANGTTPTGTPTAAGTPQPAVLQPKKLISMPIASTAPILQQQLSAPPSSIQQQLPLHPLPQAQAVSVHRATPSPVVSARISSNGLPPNIVVQATVAAHPSPQTPQPTLPVTPHPMTPLGMAQPSPAPTTPLSVAPATPMTPQQPSPAIQGQNPPLAQSPSATTNGGMPQDMQEQAISAIMQSLMNDSAQFEADKCKQHQQQMPSPGGAQLVGGAQLPTRPVPPGSLTGVVTTGNKSMPSPSATPNSKLMANRVTFQSLLNAQVQTPATPPSPSGIGSGTPTKVNAMPQLAAQLSRPVSLPPTYTQAVAQAQIQAQTVQTNSEGTTRTLLVQAPQLIRRQSSVGGDFAKVSSSLSQDAPGLQALLANAPSADNPHPVSSNGSQSRSILERLVSGGQATGTSNALSSATMAVSTSSAIASFSTSNPRSHLLAGTSLADSTQEITLTAILAKAPSNNSSTLSLTSNSASPAKASPLLQQLRQPVQQSTAQQILQQSSPLRQQSQSGQSPRMIQPSPTRSFSVPSQLQQSPRGHVSNLHMMHPPGHQRVPSSTQQSILSATLQQVQPQQQTVTLLQGGAGGMPMVSMPVQDLVTSQHHQVQVNQVPNGILTNGPSTTVTSMSQQLQAAVTSQPQNVMSLQSLLQSGVVQVSTSGNVASSSQSNMVQLSIPGLSAPVTLSLNLPSDSGMNAHQGHHQQPPSIIMASQASLQPKQQSIATTVGKLLQANNSSVMGQPTAVVLQSTGNHSNFIQVPQQPSASVNSSLGTTHIQQGSYIKTMEGRQLVQVRHGSQGQVVLQMPGSQAGGVPVSQPIQIVRAMAQPQQVIRAVQQQGPNQQQIVQLNSIKSPPMLAATPSPQGLGGIPPSPSGSITSPQSVMSMLPDSPRVHLSGGGPPTPGSNEVLMSGPPGVGLGGAHATNSSKTGGINAQNSLKLRQQHKQSLK